MLNKNDLLTAKNLSDIKALKLLMPEPSIKKKSLSISQQLLVLDYLGVIDKLQNVVNGTNKAEFLELLLNKNGQNIRSTLSTKGIAKYSRISTEKKKIEKDLKVVEQLFINLGLTSCIIKVKKDLNALKK